MEEESSELGLPTSVGDDTNADGSVFAAGAPGRESIEERLVGLLDSYTSIATCCRETGERLDRLERHMESLRQAMMSLNRKIDVQTGYARY
ncbi:putative fusion protein [Parapoxvirus red deer/HL953]|uniref:Putative fusion protein n=1 Tax=Parapoxvirus red deer/HL953 TaxID=1579460 RepID=A0A0A7M9T8_9POXV|nr:putative fusion protein [Parapoxvirus red deer/HL953]AIZ77355.1 putative fusion protein [Parapoxvirus red deer/HL953]